MPRKVPGGVPIRIVHAPVRDARTSIATRKHSWQNCDMHIAERPPSTTWEPIPLADAPQSFVWAWFKPPAAPQGVCVRIPEETFRNPARRQPVTIRSVLHALGVEPRQVAVWSLYGVSYDGQQLANPAWDYPIPEPGMAADPTIGIYLHSVPLPVTSAVPAPVLTPQGTQTGTFSRMEADWNACLQIELQLTAAAKQLNATLLRVNSLNRDMSPEEARCGDSQDKRDWQEARRWLRDVASRVSRFLKDHLVGITSNAGKRNSYDAIYEQYVVPRRHFDGLEQAERDFDAYRKSLQTLLTNMGAVNSTAVQEGERRAQQVMTRVATKIRNSRAKR